jgi:hypothetical protein
MNDQQVASWVLSPLAPIIEGMMEAIPDLIEMSPVEDASRYVACVQRCCEYLIEIAAREASGNVGAVH